MLPSLLKVAFFFDEMSLRQECWRQRYMLNKRYWHVNKHEGVIGCKKGKNVLVVKVLGGSRIFVATSNMTFLLNFL
jgi:hypothetical protein